jgi:hypothetical protein
MPMKLKETNIKPDSVLSDKRLFRSIPLLG